MDVAVNADLVAGGGDLRGDAGERSTCSPTRKNVAVAPAAASASSTAGVPSGCGPSSKVSATPLSAARRQGMPRRSRRAGRAAPAPATSSRRRRQGRARAAAARHSGAAALRALRGGEHEGGGGGQVREARIGPARCPERALDRRAELAARPTTWRARSGAAPRRCAGYDRVPSRTRRPRSRASSLRGRSARRSSARARRGGHPLGHAVGEGLDAHARLACEARGDPRAQSLVVPAEADDLRHAIQRERDLDRTRDIADAPAAARDEHDRRRPAAARAPAARPRRPWARELRPREAVHAVDLGRGPGDAPHLRDRLGVGDEMDVDPGTRPVVERREVGDRRDDRDRQPAGRRRRPSTSVMFG